jgi:two-component system, LytTR family, sensor kinase
LDNSALICYICTMNTPEVLHNPRSLHLLVWASLLLTGLLVFSIYFPFWIVATHALSNVLLLVILFYGSGAIINRFYERGKIAQTILYESILFFATLIPRIYINLYLAEQYKPEAEEDPVFTLFWRTTALGLATSAFIFVFGISYALLRNRIRREEQTRALLAEQQAAQLDFLKAQINPHFLFNALNNIYSLVELKSPDAPRMLLKLSDLLRYVIYEGRQKTVQLSKEIVHIENFIQLFQMRSEHPVNIIFETSTALKNVEIEPMILIPLVENCFKHTDFELNPKAYARIHLNCTDRTLKFTTENTFAELDRQKDKSGGVGLHNINRRLQLRYPNQHHFEHRIENDRFFTHLTLQIA